MLGGILFLTTIVLFGFLAGIMARSALVRCIITVVFGLCWMLVVGQADDGRDAVVLWMAWTTGMGLFLLGVWITSRIQRSMNLNHLAEATTEELHEGLLTLIDVHGDGGSGSLQHEWLAWPYEAQRDWVRRHRTSIKRELAAAAQGRGFSPNHFWSTMQSLPGPSLMHQPPPPEEVVWDAKVHLPDGSREAIAIFADTRDEARQMLVSHYGVEATVVSMERRRQE